MCFKESSGHLDRGVPTLFDVALHGVQPEGFGGLINEQMQQSKHFENPRAPNT